VWQVRTELLSPVSAHGKRHRYRYYVCWTRQRYGVGACEAARIRADELEAAVFDALTAVYADPDLLREAGAEQAAESEAEA
jgi:site-specific DNA recombinase